LDIRLKINNLMFKAARLKLTIWYLLIIMTISLSFSVFIYNIVASDLQRRLTAIETRLNLQRRGMVDPQQGQLYVLLDDLTEAKEKLLFILLDTNITILVISAIGGYLLAGKTLSPIEKAMDEQKRFISDAGHELKTPLTALQTSIEVALRDKKLTLREAKYELHESLQDINKMTNLTNNLLVLSRLQGKNGSVNKSKHILKDVAQGVIKKLKPIADSKKLTIKLSGGNFSAKFDRDDFEKLLTILLDNAIKYTQVNGKIAMEIVGKYKEFDVKIVDNGIGISKQDLPHVFERFYRADSSRSKNNSDGYGLGLSIAKNIVDNNQGSISVKSILGKGSEFLVKLPKA